MFAMLVVLFGSAHAQDINCVQLYRQGNAFTSWGAALSGIGGASGLTALVSELVGDPPPGLIIGTGGAGLLSGVGGTVLTLQGKAKTQEFKDFKCVVNASGDTETARRTANGKRVFEIPVTTIGFRF